GRTSWLDEEAPPAGFLKARLVTLPDGTPPQDAERSLPNARNGAVALTDRGGRCRGVLTAAGLREPCPAIASPLTVRAALRAFLDDGGDALAIAAGGSEGPLEALLTARDLALFTGHDIPGLIRALEGARSQVELEPLLTPGRKAVLAALAQPHDVDDCLRAASAINLAAARAALRVDAGNTHSAGGRRCCWLLTGDAARGDSLLVAAPPLTQLADDASAFEEHCLEAIRDPLAGGLYERRAALDFQFVEGDAGRYEQFQEAIGAALRAHPETVSLLANDTLSQLPPLTFFRDLVLHLDGAQQETLDLDAAALHPIADAARVFALAQGRLGLPRTIDRLEAAARDYPSAEAVLRQAAAAFRTAVFHRTVNGGPLVHPGALRKLDQRLLKTAFSSVQSLLELTSATFFWSAA
ncbi:MAG TPA: hypothetical protein DEH78_18190, partial [Solibacterales bacterium]|nr:hypothetical protein [Bryobacterales bacterium]